MSTSPEWKLMQAKVATFTGQPFWATLISRLKLRPDSDLPFIGGTDGVILLYNPQKVAELPPPQVQTFLAHESEHCFAPGTFIAGSDLPIEQCSVLDQVVAENGEINEITDVMQRDYSGDMVTIRGRGLLPIQVTPEHPILTVSAEWVGTIANTPSGRGSQRVMSCPQWKKAGELSLSDWLLIPKVKPLFSSLNLQEYGYIGNATDDIAYLLGWYTAEGWTTDYQVGFALSSKEMDIAARLQEILKETFGVESSLQIRTDCNGIVVRCSSVNLVQFLNRACGKGAHSKRIPPWILYHENECLLKAFLKGYINGDGFITDSVSFATVSKTLAMQLQLAFARFGVLVNLNRRDGKHSSIRGKEFYGGDIYIGKTAHWIAFNLLDVDRRLFTHRSTTWFQDTGDHIAVKIKEISLRKYSGPVFNFETDPSHTYTAGNIVVHNCAHGHNWRRGHRDLKIWNYACDHVVNNHLLDAGFQPIPNWLCERRFKDMSAEQVFDILVKEGAGQGKGSGMQGELIGEMGEPGNAEFVPALEAEWATAVIQAAAISKQMGNMPAFVKGMVQDIREPKVDWRSVLHRFMQQNAKVDYSWSRPNPRYIALGAYMPCIQSEEMPPIIFGIDYSGSCVSVLNDFASEASGAVDSCRPERTYVMWWDTKVNKPYDVFERGEEIEFNPVGGGGTAVRDLFETIANDGIEPACLVILTDGCIFDLNKVEAPDYPVLWCVTEKHWVPPFGEHVYVPTEGAY